MNTSFSERLGASIDRAGSPLCVGLDTDERMIPDSLRSVANPLLEFNRRIIDATAPYAAAFKVNLAFYESRGSLGMDALRGTLEHIPREILTVGDAKRGDIANTAAHYARALFEDLAFDATTANPYMGMDSLAPFFEYEGRGVFVLALTTNPGSADFQRLDVGGVPLYQRVIERTLESFGGTHSVGFVVGATRVSELSEVRSLVGGQVPLLVPGFGAQGGDVAAAFDANGNGLALFNVSRAIIGAGTSDETFTAARDAAAYYQLLMSGARSEA